MIAALVVGMAIGVLFGAWFFLRPQQRVSPPAKVDGELALVKRQLEDAASAAEVEGNVLAVCAARGWEIEKSLHRNYRYQAMSLGFYRSNESRDAEEARLKDWWTINGHSAPSLAEAWDRACAHHDLEAKLKEKHAKEEK